MPPPRGSPPITSGGEAEQGDHSCRGDMAQHEVQREQEEEAAARGASRAETEEGRPVERRRLTHPAMARRRRREATSLPGRRLRPL